MPGVNTKNKVYIDEELFVRIQNGDKDALSNCTRPRTDHYMHSFFLLPKIPRMHRICYRIHILTYIRKAICIKKKESQWHG